MEHAGAGARGGTDSRRRWGIGFAVGLAVLLGAPGAAHAALVVGAPATVDEKAGTVTISVTRTGLGLEDASASLSVAPGTATPGSDHGGSVAPGLLTWGFLEGGTKTAKVTIAQDALDEDDESFAVVVSSAQETVTGSPARIAIRDDDAPPVLTLGDVQAAEGTSATPTTLQVPVALSAPSGREITARVATSAAPVQEGAPPQATPDADYTPTDATVTIPAGATQGTLSVPVVADGLDEGDERFAAELSDPHNATVDDAAAIATISDDDVPTVAVGILDQREGTGGTTAYAFPVVLTNPSTRAIEVDLATKDAQATAPADYAAQSATVSFAPGETVKTFTVAVGADTQQEPDEGFTVEVLAARGAKLPPIPGIGVIRNDDRTAVSPQDAAGRLPGGAATGKVRLRNVRGAKGRVTATLLCPAAAGSCSGRVTFFTVPSRRHKIRALRKERRLGTVSYRATGGGTATLRLSLKAADRKLLRRARALRVEAFAVNASADGTSQVASAKGTVKR